MVLRQRVVILAVRRRHGLRDESQAAEAGFGASMARHSRTSNAIGTHAYSVKANGGSSRISKVIGAEVHSG
jgi:hypothetical protein